MILGLPWWIFMMILFIFLSGYMSFRAMKAEKKLDQHYIEHEGKVYINRIHSERKRRREKSSQSHE